MASYFITYPNKSNLTIVDLNAYQKRELIRQIDLIKEVKNKTALILDSKSGRSVLKITFSKFEFYTLEVKCEILGWIQPEHYMEYDKFLTRLKGLL